jgi:hypothetical protein
MSDSSTGQLPSTPGRENSRESLAGAGWGGIPEDLSALLPVTLRGKPPFSWLRLSPSPAAGATTRWPLAPISW